MMGATAVTGVGIAAMGCEDVAASSSEAYDLWP